MAEERWEVEGDPVGRDDETFAIVLSGPRDNLPFALVPESRALRAEEEVERLRKALSDNGMVEIYERQGRLTELVGELRSLEERTRGARWWESAQHRTAVRGLVTDALARYEREVGE